jgi:hypothetical protein
MAGFWHLNLIHFLDFYFAFFFLANTMRRWTQYRIIGKLVVTSPGRWPRLLSLIQENKTIVLTWTTFLPGLLALGISILQVLASRLVWPEAGVPPHGLTVERLAEHWPFLVVVLPLALAVLAFDLYSLFFVGAWNQEEIEKHFDQAEYWLHSGTAHVVHIFTLGFINPRKMVKGEVRKALHEFNAILHNTFWWVIMQTGLRLLFGLSLWLSWVLTMKW